MRNDSTAEFTRIRGLLWLALMYLALIQNPDGPMWVVYGITSILAVVLSILESTR